MLLFARLSSTDTPITEAHKNLGAHAARYCNQNAAMEGVNKVRSGHKLVPDTGACVKSEVDFEWYHAGSVNFTMGGEESADASAVLPAPSRGASAASVDDPSYLADDWLSSLKLCQTLDAAQPRILPLDHEIEYPCDFQSLLGCLPENGKLPQLSAGNMVSAEVSVESSDEMYWSTKGRTFSPNAADEAGCEGARYADSGGLEVNDPMHLGFRWEHVSADPDSTYSSGSCAAEELDASGTLSGNSTARAGASIEVVVHYRSPSEEEIMAAMTSRARKALENWYKQYNELVDHKMVHGTCDVPQSCALGKFVNKQREQRKFFDAGQKSNMTVHKIAALNGIGFAWGTPKGESSWEFRFKQLQEYRRRHGDCLVPTKYDLNPALGRWVSAQRYEYKKYRQGLDCTHMTEDRVDRLNEIGFRWSAADVPKSKRTARRRSSMSTAKILSRRQVSV